MAARRAGAPPPRFLVSTSKSQTPFPSASCPNWCRAGSGGRRQQIRSCQRILQSTGRSDPALPSGQACKSDRLYLVLPMQAAKHTFTPASPITIQPAGMPPGVPYLLLPSAEQNPAPPLLPPRPCPSDVLLTMHGPPEPLLRPLSPLSLQHPTSGRGSPPCTPRRLPALPGPAPSYWLSSHCWVRSRRSMRRFASKQVGLSMPLE